MVPTAVLEKLAAHPALGTLDAHDRAVLAGFLDVLDLASGTVLIREGDADRDLYVVLDGMVRMRRGALDLGHAVPGELLGELALVEPQQPRAATIVADGPVTAVRLSQAAFQRLVAHEPAVAFRLTQLFVRGLGRRLRALTDDIGSLLHERSLPRRRFVRVRVSGDVRAVRTGEPVGSVLPDRADGEVVVAALLDGRAVSLSEPLTSDCAVEPLTTEHWEGRRIYRQSLALLLLEAAARVAPGVDLSLDHSLGMGRCVRVAGWGGALGGLAATVQDEMVALVKRDQALQEEWWTRDEASDHFEITGRRRMVDLLRTRRQPTVRLQSYGDVFTLATSPLLPATGAMGEFGLVEDTTDLVLMYGSASTGEGTPAEDDPKQAARRRARDARAVSLNAALRNQTEDTWLGAVELASIGQFNQRCIDGSVGEIIHVAEGAQEKRIANIADAIAARADEVRVVCIAGPSSSGKTTFIKRLRVQLQVNGIRPIGLSLDDYFRDREQTPRDASGDYDFEAFDALRRDLLDDHLRRILAGETVRTARFDFPSGRSLEHHGPSVSLGPRQILMVEGIHGLNPALLPSVPRASVFRVFVCPLAQLPLDDASRVHASDVRLLRRIVRDRHGRGQGAAATIARWPSVRRGERRHIFPFVSNADAVFDSSLVFELSVLKVFAERYLLEVPPGDPATVTAFRLLALLDDFVTIYPDHVPPTSILREFIGGSGFEYL
ncbi:MAG: cyclic nucleotide-binding domain-containing protein [Alphaproteobacteria bacterium]|nr:cyclic nucleotide-binding domain-containing protein [Alphaproteobacteria bacterium]